MEHFVEKLKEIEYTFQELESKLSDPDIVNDQEFIDQLKITELIFKQHLEKLKKLTNVKEIRVHGMLAAIDLVNTIEWKKFMNEGIYLVSQKNRIIIAPPLIISKSELEFAMKKIENVLQQNEGSL